MIDFHTHILPRMDDGSRSIDESLQMIRILGEQNVSRIVLTPHFYASNESPDSFLERREKRLALLKSGYTENYPVLIAGAEIEYFDGVTSESTLKKLKIGKTDAILLEMPFEKWHSRVINDILEINSRGFDVIIAHIERYCDFQSNAVLKELVSHGVIMQSNTSFFIDRFKRRKALKMLSNGMIHLLGTDCHNVTSRAPDFKIAVEIIENKFGGECIGHINDLGRRILEKEMAAVRNI